MNFARLQNLLIAVRAGGHNVAGNSVCDADVLIDVSRTAMAIKSIVPGKLTVGSQLIESSTLNDALELNLNGRQGDPNHREGNKDAKGRERDKRPHGHRRNDPGAAAARTARREPLLHRR